MKQDLPIYIKGHVHIVDDLGKVYLNQNNAIHPQNMARVIARALAHEDNSYIYRMAFGNGGTIVSDNEEITYNVPNDGQSPDPNTWNSQLYNETYSEVVDDQSVYISQGLGAVPEDDPVCVPNVSGPGVRSAEKPPGLLSTVQIQCTLNASEPTSQYLTDMLGSPGFPESNFTFDEIGLFTGGLPLQPTPGYNDVNVSSKYITDETGLDVSSHYNFEITVDGVGPTEIDIITPNVGSGPGGTILFGDLIDTIQPALVGATVDISGGNSNTFGFLRFSSDTAGAASSLLLTDGVIDGISRPLFSNLQGFVAVLPPVEGRDGGIKDAASAPETEAARMLTHIIFSPILKSANRTLTITYTLTISVARSTPPEGPPADPNVFGNGFLLDNFNE